tara:strand:+ start:707 stop:1450 length:744 start_codon:yes stop_codon:yes gene_type:complete
MDPFVVSEEQLDFYRENGYLVLKGVFSKEETDIMRKDMDEFADGYYTNYLNLQYYKSLKQAHRGKKMCDIADAIFGARAVPIGATAFFCKPNNPKENGSTWHQDNYGGRTPTGDTYINAAVAVDPADEKNGALMVIPKSHKLGELPSNPKPNFSYDEDGRMYNSAPIGNDCEVPEGSKIVQLRYEAGDVLVLHAFTLHKAEKNSHPTLWRRAMYFMYNQENEPFWPGWTARRELLERYDSPNYDEEE